MRRRGWAAAALIAGAVWLSVPAVGSAQVADSVSIRIRESLRRLDLPPSAEPDTLAADSLAVTELAVVARPGAPAPRSADSVIAALQALPGYDATQYRGTTADFDVATRVLVLHGDSVRRASVIRQGTELTADSVIEYDEARGTIRAEGRPLFTAPEGDPVQSQRVIYDIATQRGSAFGARTRYSEGATWYVTGDLPSVTPGVVYGVHTDFTSCDLEVPHYHFSADHIKIVAGRILVARPVRLYFADVPVAWLPFIAQSLGTGRASGLLTPRFSVNDIVRTSGGYQRRVSNVGFYWAMSDYADATVALDWFSGNFTSLTGSFRYGWLRQFLNGSLNMRRYWRDEGGTELAFDTNHGWKMDERTSLRVAARYSSSTDFVRRNSFDPREVTQSINSTGGIDRRFDWGNLSLSGNRDQFLSDDRVEMTLPQAQLNLSTITLFRAPALRSRWFNNLTWSGGMNGERRMIDRSPRPGDSITTATADLRNVRAGARSSFGLGNLSWSQSLTVDRGSVLQLPLGFLTPLPALGMTPSGRALVRSAADAAAVEAAQTVGDVAQTNVTWSTRVGYQQTLIGSTTITPQLSLSGNSRRADTLGVSRDGFVAAPARLALGASLKSDLFGFFPGGGPFEAIRHKISPGLNFSFAPEVTSTPLQVRVFGRQAIQPRKELTFSLNQTFEAKRRAQPGDSAGRISSPTSTLASQPVETAGGLAAGGQSAPGPRRMQRPDIVTLLALRTTAVQYDFVEADTAGHFLFGFRTTRISNQISSDFLQGLSISMAHDLFADSTIALPGGGTREERRFDPHLADLNLGFTLNNRSALFRGFGLFGGAPEEEADTATEPRPPEDPFVQTTAATDEATIIPGVDRRDGGPRVGPQRAADVGSWSANFTYALARARTNPDAGNQMLGVSLRLKPTAQWDLSWRTSYDLERGAFNDHSIGLSRDLHDWEARFDFAQTAMGNWMFRFDIALKANRDFKFDYKQQNVDRPPLR